MHNSKYHLFRRKLQQLPTLVLSMLEVDTQRPEDRRERKVRVGVGEGGRGVEM